MTEQEAARRAISVTIQACRTLGRKVKADDIAKLYKEAYKALPASVKPC